jgi:hypothetical protein
MLPLSIEIDVSDINGIDVVGTGPDEGLTLEIEGVKQKHSINHSFQFSEGDFRQGSAAVTLKENDIQPGLYKMRISAQDLLGNISKKALTLEIVDETVFKMGLVYNYPNPVRHGEHTRFYIYHSNNHANSEIYWQGDVASDIKIYTLNGRLIRVFSNVEQNGVQWDLTDQRGNRLPPNIYLWQVTTHVDMPSHSRVEKSPVQKLVIHPPFR